MHRCANDPQETEATLTIDSRRVPRYAISQIPECRLPESSLFVSIFFFPNTTYTYFQSETMEIIEPDIESNKVPAFLVHVHLALFIYIEIGHHSSLPFLV